MTSARHFNAEIWDNAARAQNYNTATPKCDWELRCYAFVVLVYSPVQHCPMSHFQLFFDETTAPMINTRWLSLLLLLLLLRQHCYYHVRLVNRPILSAQIAGGWGIEPPELIRVTPSCVKFQPLTGNESSLVKCCLKYSALLSYIGQALVVWRRWNCPVVEESSVQFGLTEYR